MPNYYNILVPHLPTTTNLLVSYCLNPFPTSVYTVPMSSPLPMGLTTTDAHKLIDQFGYNEIISTQQSRFKVILARFLSPISLMLLTASVLSLLAHKTFDFYFILILLLVNQIIVLWQEHKADSAIAALNKRLSAQTKVFRDNKWQSLDARELVRGDLIEIGVGDVVPADGTIVESQNLSINESSLTGESLPVDKHTKAKVFSGSFVATGSAKITITATGSHTYFGKTLMSVDRNRKSSLLEKDVLTITKFLTVISLIAVVLLSAVLLYKRDSILELLTLDLSLVIAGIPISLPTVMSLIIELGVLGLAKKQVIVRRLSALEDLANVNLLLTDKTGTLTKNQISVGHIDTYSHTSSSELLHFASLVSNQEKDHPINQAIIAAAKKAGVKPLKAKIISFTPADSERKRSTTTIKTATKTIIISFGAPQVVLKLCRLSHTDQEQVYDQVNHLASEGYRTVALAINDHQPHEHNMKLLGLFALSDTLRPETNKVLKYLTDRGVEIVMITGDNRAIAAQIIKKLHLNKAKVLTKNYLRGLNFKKPDPDLFKYTAAFAEILPDDKYKLVEAGKRHYVVAATGDGVNDLPAIKSAQVGIAVQNAVDALKAAADIVLLTNGISVIQDAIVESQKIFARIYSYSIYRLSESLRLIITIAVLGIWYQEYPLTPLQLILLALLNDIPIISLAFDRVKIVNRPSHINVKERFTISSIFGLIGVANSILLFLYLTKIIHAPWAIIQTLYFLKLTIGGHMLIYVARTKLWWFKFLPAKAVIIATSITQLIATLLAVTGFLMPAKLSMGWIIFIWIWTFFWMQISELTKHIPSVNHLVRPARS